MRGLIPAIVLAGWFSLAVEADPSTKFDAPVASPSEKPLDLQLQQACTTSDLNQITNLLNQGAAIDGVDSQGRTPLMLAALYNQMAVVTLLLDKGAKIDVQDNKACTALVYACSKNNHDVAMALLDKGANCNLFDQTGRLNWPMNCAAKNGDVTLLSALLDHKAEINRASCWGTPLANAALWNQWKAFDFLISKGSDPNIPDSYKDCGRTPLIEAARDSGTNSPDALTQTQTLLKAGANPNFKSKSGMTALMYAAQNNNTGLAQVLIDGGADINVTDNDRETALTLAGDRGRQEMVAFLKSKGASPLDIHIIARDKPTTPLTPAQAWVLAVGAIYTQAHGTNPYFLGSQVEQYKFAVKRNLNVFFSIKDQADLLQKLNYLTSTGDRAQAQIVGAQLAAMSDAKFKDFLWPLSWYPSVESRAIAARQSYLKWKSKSGLGYDLCLYVLLVNQGYTAGYLNDKEAWALLIPLGQQVQNNFNSWPELGENFLDGYEVVNGTRDPGFEASVQLLSNPKDPNSPWNECPWNTDLSK